MEFKVNLENGFLLLRNNMLTIHAQPLKTFKKRLFIII